MWTVDVEEDSVGAGFDSAEQICTSADEDPDCEKGKKERRQKESSSGTSAIGSYVVHSLQSTVRSAKEFLPASLGGGVDQARSEFSWDSVEVEDDNAEACNSAVENPGRETREKEAGKKDTSSSTSTSTVGSFAGDTAESTVKTATGFLPASPGSEADQAKSECSLDSDEAVNGNANENGTGKLSSEGSTSSGSAALCAAVDLVPEESDGDNAHIETRSRSFHREDEIPEAEGVGTLEHSVKAQSSASNDASEPEVLEEDIHPMRSLSGHVADWPHFSDYGKPVSSLRRRSRSLSKGSKDGSIVANSFCANSVLLPEKNNPSALPKMQTRPQSRSHSLSGVSGYTKGSTQLQSEDEDTASEVANDKPLTKRKESLFHSGYDSEVEDDDNDASSASSRAAIALKRKWLSLEDDGWEEVGSSSELEETRSISETRQSREVHITPNSEVEGEENEGEAPTQLLLHPAGFIVRAIGFQMKLIFHVLAIGIWLLTICLSTLSHPLNRTLAVKDRVAGIGTGTVNQVVGGISLLSEGVAQAGPVISKVSKKTFWGCLSAAYAIFVLGLLIIPVIFVDLIVVHRVVKEPVVIRKILDFDYTQPKPVALFPLFSPVEMERVQNLAPEKIVNTRVIPARHKFHITAVFTLPESEYNMNLGMFQVTTELLSARNQVLLRSSKPCRLRFSSLPIRLVKSVIYAVPLLIGLSTETQKLKIRLLEAQEKVTPTASVRILLESKASYRNGGGVPDIYNAAVVLESTPPWLQGIMSNWKWTFYVWNGICLFLLEVGIVLCCWPQLIIPRFGRQKRAKEEIVQGEIKDERANTLTRRVMGTRPSAAGVDDVRDTGRPMHKEEAGVEEGTAKG